MCLRGVTAFEKMDVYTSSTKIKRGYQGASMTDSNNTPEAVVSCDCPYHVTWEIKSAKCIWLENMRVLKNVVQWCSIKTFVFRNYKLYKKNWNCFVFNTFLPLPLSIQKQVTCDMALSMESVTASKRRNEFESFEEHLQMHKELQSKFFLRANKLVWENSHLILFFSI